ncbi:hypothetical protein Nham_4230 (plasmid) [Nitrobacter hamburgensis X14]|uniref:Uncharacterized protein n=1 Tax=Nitrobacter hamburgensis (strain DSM 10229 / NCIMB 13809 / X14) TaxID=323097 RepID=Q1QG01_NITHX|nr:hypothetical protein Nham_4230 [Nitrobacter hamburgensis X14]
MSRALLILGAGFLARYSALLSGRKPPSGSVCIVAATGTIVREVKIASDPEALVRYFDELELPVGRIGLEAGLLSQWLHAGLMAARRSSSRPKRTLSAIRFGGPTRSLRVSQVCRARFSAESRVLCSLW